MLIGGFQHINMDKVMQPTIQKHLPLRCDTASQYTRQILTNTGRTATIYLLEQCMGFSEDDFILLPDYLCLSVIVSIEAPKVHYQFYKITRDLNIDMDDLKSKINEHVKAIYVIEYFGVPYEQDIVAELKQIRSLHGIMLIEDLTQTLLSKDENRMGFGDYIVASTRKWLPMTDGGILAARDGSPLVVKEIESGYNEATYKQLLISLMREYYDENPNLDREGYLQLEKAANKARYTDLSVRDMTEFSRNILFASDIDSIVKQRISNYNYLYDNLKNFPGVTIVSKPLDPDGNHVPFGLFLLVEKRDDFYNFLVKRDIIGEIQWLLPTEYYKPGEDATFLADHNLMIHCDQRYSETEMNYVLNCIRAYFDNNYELKH